MSVGGRGKLPDGLAQNGLYIGCLTSIDWAVAAWIDCNDPYNWYGYKSGYSVSRLGGEGRGSQGSNNGSGSCFQSVRL